LESPSESALASASVLESESVLGSELLSDFRSDRDLEMPN
jgi:hypothetical protein